MGETSLAAGGVYSLDEGFDFSVRRYMGSSIRSARWIEGGASDGCGEELLSYTWAYESIGRP